MTGFRRLNLPAALLLIVLIAGCAHFSLVSMGPSPHSRLDPTKWAYDHLLFEIAPVQSATPDPRALARFRELLNDYRVCPADRITFLVHEEYGVPYNIWTMRGIIAYEKRRRELIEHDSTDRVGIVFVSYLEGPTLRSEEGLQGLGGIQYSSSAFSVFKSYSDGKEALVMLHEFGHMIGLRGEEESTDPPHHCPDRYCAMYKTIGSRFAVLCKDCITELDGIILSRRKRRVY